MPENRPGFMQGMKSPPAGVKLVMEAVCIMRGVKPGKIKDPNTGKSVEDYWENAKKLLMEADFLEKLRSFDKDNIDPKIINAIPVSYTHLTLPTILLV